MVRNFKCHKLLSDSIMTELTVTCVAGVGAGSQIFDCDSTNELVSIVCSFDGGDVENCSFPLEVRIDRFGTELHTVIVTVVDEFGQSLNLTLDFNLTPRKYCRCLIYFKYIFKIM